MKDYIDWGHGFVVRRFYFEYPDVGPAVDRLRKFLDPGPNSPRDEMLLSFLPQVKANLDTPSPLAAYAKELTKKNE